MPGKRGSSPTSSDRPSKRIALSSPEEGEVDDKTASTTTPDDAPPSSHKFQSRVPFPFKKQPKPRSASPSRSPSRSPPAKHRLPARDRERERDEVDRHRLPSPLPPTRRGHDRYVPAYDRRGPYDTRSDSRDIRRDREYDSYRPGYGESYESRRERDRDGYEREPRREHRVRSPPHAHYRPRSPPLRSSPRPSFSPPSLPPPPPLPPPPIPASIVDPSPPPPPPPPPPPIETAPTLQPQHDCVKFAITKPKDTDRPAKRESDRERHERPEHTPPPITHPSPKKTKPRRPPVKRTPSQEHTAYARFFSGVGRMDAYDVTTKVGEGTFGEVHKATHRPSATPVALKRILMHNEKEGMPVTALREIRILKRLSHPNVVQLREVVVGEGVGAGGGGGPTFHMVFPYMDHDLAGLLENERVQMTPSQIKLYMRQLLEGTAYLHANNIIHRDMKAANLLISNMGVLQIADFGLARAFDPRVAVTGRRDGPDTHASIPRYTNCVVTRWYRPPELFLGARRYGGEIDIWGIGCVLGEIFTRRPILMGTSDANQLDLIWQLCGTPSGDNWPDYDALPGLDGVKRWTRYPRQIKEKFHGTGTDTVDLLDKLLILDPAHRITAAAALDHDYFWTDPMPADPKSLPKYESSHEIDKRARRHMPAPIPHAPLPHPPLTAHLTHEPHSLPPPLYLQPGFNMHNPHPHPGPHGPGRPDYRPGPGFGPHPGPGFGPPPGPPVFDPHRPPPYGDAPPPHRDRGPGGYDSYRPGHPYNQGQPPHGPGQGPPFPPPGTHSLPPRPGGVPVPFGRGAGAGGGGREKERERDGERGRGWGGRDGAGAGAGAGAGEREGAKKEGGAEGAAEGGESGGKGALPYD
ncbi:Pkinase-domain-containing protein [Ramaria rubella]|nr:Pkinase-domain-containing protein [Ramaria rubella]